MPLPLDLLPHGLKKAVAPKLAGKEGRGFVKVLLKRARRRLRTGAAKAEEAGKGDSRPLPGDGAQASRTLKSPLECQMLDLKFEYEN